MTDGKTSVEPESEISAAYSRAARINAKLASSYSGALVTEGKALAEALLAHVKEQVADYEDFVSRVERSEEFSLHDSAQMKKDDKALKTLYLRATGLLETIREAEKIR